MGMGANHQRNRGQRMGARLVLIALLLAAGCARSTDSSDSGAIPVVSPSPRAPAPIPLGGDLALFSQDAAVVGIQQNPLGAPDSGGTSILYTASNTLTWAVQGGSEVYGDGSDGVASFDGSATPTGSVLSGGNYTISRNVYYSSVNVHTGVTVSVGTTVPPTSTGSGYGIFCSGNFINNGTVSAAGGNAPSTAAGGKGFSHLSVGSYMGGANGVPGSTGAAGSGGVVATTGFGGAGGAGGAGGTGAGGAGGTVTAPATTSFPRAASAAILGYTTDNISSSQVFTQFFGGAGGGGGGGDGTNSGGAGGGGGGVLVATMASLSGNGSFTSAGGAGFNGAAAGNTGGGGGGGGGVTMVYYGTSAFTGTFSAAGGAGGALHGTGVAGTAGSAGVLIDTGL